MLVVSQPPPLAFLVFLLSDWWEAGASERQKEHQEDIFISTWNLDSEIASMYKLQPSILG